MTQRRRRGLNPGWLLTVARSAAIARVGAYYSLIVLMLYDACGRSPDPPQGAAAQHISARHHDANTRPAPPGRYSIRRVSSGMLFTGCTTLRKLEATAHGDNLNASVNLKPTSPIRAANGQQGATGDLNSTPGCHVGHTVGTRWVWRESQPSACRLLRPSPHWRCHSA